MKKIFIPHEDNEYKPYVLRDAGVKVLLGVILSVELLFVLLVSPVFEGKIDYLAAIVPSTLVSLTNETRQDHHLTILEPDIKLWAAAQLKANDMAERGYFSHNTPDGRNPWYWLKKVGYEYNVAGENLAVHFFDSEDVHRAWMNSPGHRSNILRADFKEIGIATAQGTFEGRKAIFTVQFFADPLESDRVAMVPPIGTVQNTLQEAEVQVAALGALGDSVMVFSSPISMLLGLLTLLLVIVLFALVVKIGIKVRLQSPELIAHGVLLVVIIMTFLYLNSELISLYGQIA